MKTIPGLVTCLMVTQARRQRLAVEALDDFGSQTYLPRELVVVSDDPECQEYVLGRFAVWFILAPRGLTLGELRNLAVDNARGEFVAQWDDDDRSAPDRLAVQLDHMATTGAPACMLSRVTLDWLGQKEAVSGKRPWEGTLVSRRDRVGRYPSMSRGEEVDVALATGFSLLDGRPELYRYRYHGENTWDEEHFRVLWAKRQREAAAKG